MNKASFTLDRPFAALIFDCDGTLVDTAGAHLAAYNVAIANGGVSMSWEWYRSRLGTPARDLLLEFVSEHQLTFPIDELVAKHAAAFNDSFDSVQEIAVVADVARAYQGKVPLAVASNGMRQHVEGTLRATGLLPLFDVLVGRDEVRNGKPAPDLFQEAARRLGVPALNCIVFEDSDEGLEAARSAGMFSYDVRQVFALQHTFGR